MNGLRQSSNSGFWRRFAAFFVDGLILGAVGFILGLFLTEQFVRIGVWGRLLGFCIAGLYCGILNSKLGNGQTLGKRLLDIKVVNKKGEPISPARSFLRYSILGIPYFLNGAHFPEHVLMSPAMYPLSVLIFGAGISILYLIIFNRRTRQSLHDLITGTYVIRQEAVIVDGRGIWKFHYAVVAILVLGSLVAPFFTARLADKPFLKGMLHAREAVIEAHDFAFADISEGKSFLNKMGEGTSQASYVAMNVFLKTDDIHDQAIANSVVSTILASYGEAREKDIIQVVLIHGYDIGIATRRGAREYSYSPQEWLSFIEGKQVP